jgi:hypothetical protein
MKYTLLEMTQSILSSMDSDEINSIDDTVEAQQVVTCIETVYNDMMTRGALSAHKTLFTLDASGDNTKPVLMTKPSNIQNIEWLKYNAIEDGDTDPVWQYVKFMPLADFICMVQGLNPSETNVETMTKTTPEGYSLTFHYRNDQAPIWYTSYDDNTLIFDAYDAEVDTTLQSVKTLCFGSKNTEFTKTDLFVPDLQPTQFQLLLNESKALAWSELKQTIHQKAEVSARRNWRHLSKTAQNIPSGKYLGDGNHPFDKLPSFGR